MELSGIKVRHTAFGAGVITEQTTDYITVEFAAKTAKFQYPDCFEVFVKAADAAIQAEIDTEITDKKEAKRKAEEERKRQEEAKRIAEEERRLAEAGNASRGKKSIDEMFSPDYHAEKLTRQPILTYQQVENQFGIKISGFGRGINPTDSTVVLISSIGKSGGNFVYHDRWTAEGDYIYSGEGKTGDQSMTKGNYAIKNAARDGKLIHLFVKFSPQEYYYQGKFALVNYTYEDDKDESGNIRKEYKFRLKKVE